MPVRGTMFLARSRAETLMFPPWPITVAGTRSVSVAPAKTVPIRTGLPSGPAAYTSAWSSDSFLKTICAVELEPLWKGPQAPAIATRASSPADRNERPGLRYLFVIDHRSFEVGVSLASAVRGADMVRGLTSVPSRQNFLPSLPHPSAGAFADLGTSLRAGRRFGAHACVLELPDQAVGWND